MPQVTGADVRQKLQAFGLANPTDAEITMFTGLDEIGGASDAAIAAYANFKTQETQRQASDPLKAYQDLTEKYAADSIANAGNLYTQLQGVLTEAPKLFGSLTADQVSTYLAPLKTSYDSAISTVQGVIASRGLGASSAEANALAQTEKQFQEQVLSTGLQVGQTQQAARANSIAQQIQNLFGLGTSALGEAGKAAGQRSSQDLSQSNLVGSLPYFLRSSGTAEAQAKIAADRAKGGGFQDLFNQVTGDIKQGVSTFQSLAMIPNQFQSTSPTVPGYGGGGPNLPGGNPFASPASFGPGGANAPAPNSLDLFQAP